MKYTATVSIALLAAVVGCGSNNKKPTAANPGVTDLRSASATPTPAPAPIPAPAPVVIQPAQPIVSDTPTPVIATTPAISGNTYTVQKGDTLYKIARAKYGEASAVKKILAANPGLNGNSIKAGQKINLP